MLENKQLICDKLCEVLKLTRSHADLIRLDYDAEKEEVHAVYDGAIKTANVACDSGIAMISDVLQRIGV